MGCEQVLSYLMFLLLFFHTPHALTEIQLTALELLLLYIHSDELVRQRSLQRFIGH
jgi:hypothetical protein